MPTTKPTPKGALAKEPVITVTAVTSLVSALFVAITLAVPDLDPAWEKAIIGIIAAAWPFVTAVWARSAVVSPASAVEASNKSAQTGNAIDPMQPGTWRV